VRVLYSQEVEGDLNAVADYIAVDNPRRAVSFLREIYAEIERVGQGPQLYQLRPESSISRLRAFLVIRNAWVA
jgi:plasmid stabilization system protein ParE